MPFAKGQSGNPGGRPKANKEVQALARKHTAEAINRLVYLMRQPKDLPTARAAAAILLERGWGKPQSHVEHTGKDGGPVQHEALTDTEAARLIAFTMARAIDDARQGLDHPRPAPTEVETEVSGTAPSTDTVQ